MRFEDFAKSSASWSKNDHTDPNRPSLVYACCCCCAFAIHRYLSQNPIPGSEPCTWRTYVRTFLPCMHVKQTRLVARNLQACFNPCQFFPSRMYLPPVLSLDRPATISWCVFQHTVQNGTPCAHHKTTVPAEQSAGLGLITVMINHSEVRNLFTPGRQSTPHVDMVPNLAQVGCLC